ncbi:MAG: DUF6265 family protein [Hyphomonadaceae bacterium JAD_PAG50586_4]|nr:MAG: DUF6265 family protein [Hyphomonadaceae bacterium JAD_PAG50586_4]
MRTLILIATLACAMPAHAQSLDDLTWLKGCWRTQAPRDAESGSQTTEVWIDPPGPALFGYSYTEGEGAVQGWEQMRIDAADGGRPRLVAMPGGGASIAFRMEEQIQLDDPTQIAVFENTAHDYPQRIIYQRQRNRLTATISRADGGNPYTFSYRRISCMAALRP